MIGGAVLSPRLVPDSDALSCKRFNNYSLTCGSALCTGDPRVVSQRFQRFRGMPGALVCALKAPWKVDVGKRRRAANTQRRR